MKIWDTQATLKALQKYPEYKLIADRPYVLDRENAEKLVKIANMLVSPGENFKRQGVLLCLWHKGFFCTLSKAADHELESMARLTIDEDKENES